VDDAIVVLENVTRWVEAGVEPMEAARRGMDEIAFAVISATISAVAVFVPLGFMMDMTGQLFREFAVTVASALIISGFVALTMSPMLCARFVKPRQRQGAVKRGLENAIGSLVGAYASTLAFILSRRSAVICVVLLGVFWVGLGALLYSRADQELLPKSDRSFLILFSRGPEGATVDYMKRYQSEMEDIATSRSETREVFSIIALGIGAPGVVNEGMIMTELIPPSDRSLTQAELVDELRPRLEEIAGVEAFPREPSPLRGFSSSPVEIVIQGPEIFELARMADEIKAEAEQTGLFEGLYSDVYLNKPQLDVSIDRERANDLGMSTREIAETLQIMLGGLAVSNFKVEGETYDVIVQLADQDRVDPSILMELFVRGDSGLIPLVAVVDAEFATAPRALPHYDRSRAVKVSGSPAVDASQGEALEALMAIAKSVLPEGGEYRSLWSGESEQFFDSDNALTFAYGMAILIVFLVLAAQFESFVYPLVILVAVLLSFSGALLALTISGVSLNLFSKIGIVMLVGLVTKNSILIVEFANQLRGRGASLLEAITEASRTRFRPILMTALATMVGILPIAIGSGAGGTMRQGLGVAVLGGVFFSTVLTFFVVPASYLMIENARGAKPE
ncbi:MAG: efflux RND transporter permease subunit, partial [Myxococcota bacterium]|nr:efflux RND transporter permease subunit [Myxococcota bacterium]